MNKLGAALLAAMLTLAATPARAQQKWDFPACMKMFEPKWCLDRELRKSIQPPATAPIPLPRPAPTKPAVREWRI